MGIAHLRLNPGDEPRRVDDDRGGREDLAADRIDLRREIVEKRGRVLVRLLLLLAALRRDEAAQLLDELGARRVVLQRADQPVQLVGGNRRRSGWGGRGSLRQGRTGERHEQPGDERPCPENT